jgi:putative glutamine amidotransferase
MKKELVLGYSAWSSPMNGTGPFDKLFPNKRNMIDYADFEIIDALVLWGGQDISPSLYNQTRIANSGPTECSGRDVFEWELMRECLKRSIPIIGICRGAQILCAFAGGSLIQHVSGHRNSNHSITTKDGELLTIAGDHHQMMYPYDVEHELIAWSSAFLSETYQPDNTVASISLDKKTHKEPEIVWFPKIKGLAIQGHPEWEPPNSRSVDYVSELIKEYCLGN